MYRLTPRMLQRFERDLRKYHDLFSGGRCSGWEQEELIVVAIKSDTVVQHHPRWKEAGHDDEADIRVSANGDTYALQIKSGVLHKDHLNLSGHRLGRFEGDMKKITAYLNSKRTDIIAVPHKKVDDHSGRKHVYQVSYIDAEILAGLLENNWSSKGKQFTQTNVNGVVASISPSMSWQIWWKIPLQHLEQEQPFVIE